MTTTASAGACVTTAYSVLAAGGGVVLTYGGRAAFVFAASEASTSTTAFAVRYGSGLLSAVLPFARTQELAIPSMDTSFGASERLCVAVDSAEEVTTGISASDRARTARVLGRSTSTSADLTRPGHLMVIAVNPAARPSTLSEFALRLADQSGVGSAAIITDLVGISNPTGLMSADEAVHFAEKYSLVRVDCEGIASAATQPN